MNSLRPPTRREPSFPSLSAAQLGMYVALASLSMLFAASLVAYFVTRAQSTVWRGADMPRLPAGLWVSTALIMCLTASLHWAVRKLRANQYLLVERSLLVSLGFALAFLVAQVQNWRTVAHLELAAPTKSLYTYTFYMLTALHALHVLAGLAPFAWVLVKAHRRHYSSSQSEGVRLLRQYWDFLLIVWLVLIGTLWFAH